MIKARSVGGMPTARSALLEQLRYISQARRSWKVVVAYDEHTPGSELRVMEGDVDEVFTGEGESADSYIERRAHELGMSRMPPTVKVATDDRTIQVVSLASGAEMMSTSSLIKVRFGVLVLGWVFGWELVD
jgi:predicted RNA-binding protein with PIN domain